MLEGASLDPSGVDFAFIVSEEGVPGLGVLDAESLAHFVVDPDDVCVNLVVTSRDPAAVELGLDAVAGAAFVGVGDDEEDGLTFTDALAE